MNQLLEIKKVSLPSSDTYVLTVVDENKSKITYNTRYGALHPDLRSKLNEELKGESSVDSLSININAEMIKAPSGTLEIHYATLSNHNSSKDEEESDVSNANWGKETPQTEGKLWIKGICTKVIDGDTANLKVTSVSKATKNGKLITTVKHRKKDGKAALNGNIEPLEIGDEVGIRFAGTDCREIPKHYTTYDSKGNPVRVPKTGMTWDNINDADDRNYKWLLSWGYPSNDKFLEKSYILGEDAKELTEWIENKEITIIIDDADEDRTVGDFENGIGVDKYNRFLGVVYCKTTGGTDVNINRTLVRTVSKSFPPHSLSEVSLYAGKNGKQKTTLDLAAWYNEQAYKKADSDTEKIVDDFYVNEGADFVRAQFMISKQQVELRVEPNYNYKIITVLPANTEVYVTREKDGWIQAEYMGLSGWAELSSFTESTDEYSNIEEDNDYKITNDFKEYLKRELGATIDGDKVTYGEYKTSKPEYVSNSNVIPANNEVDDDTLKKHDDRDKLDGFDDLSGDRWDNIAKPGFTRIGDCTFIVPPLSLSIISQSQVDEIPSIRAKSTVKSQTGNLRKTITMDLFFNGYEQINGYVVDRGKNNETGIPPGMVYYRNGLRPLIAQFKVAPFLPIENFSLNALGITSVAFKDLTIQTVPGFPGCIKATLELIEFDHTVYMPQEDYFEEAINWKLFRWNYQRLLQPSNAKKDRTYIAKSNNLDVKPLFYRISEDDLSDKTDAIKTLQNYVHPSIYEQQNNSTFELEKVKLDSDMARLAISQRNSIASSIDKFDADVKKLCIDSAGTFSVDIKAHYSSSAIIQKKVHTALSNTVKSAYGIGPSNKSSKISYYPNKLKDILEIINTNIDKKDINTYPCYHIDNEEIIYSLGGNVTNSGGQYSQSKNLYVSGKTGAAVIKLQSDKAKKASSANDKGFSIYVFPSGNDFQSKMDAIINIDKGNEALLDDYKATYDNLKERAQKTEKDMRYILEPIPDDYVVENITSGLHNRYAELQTQSAELAALQYLGSQTADITMSIRTKEAAVVKAFAEMHAEALKCSRMYREGVCGSVLTLNHPAINILGTNAVLLENMSITMPPEDKETTIITMSFKDFDKTQRLKEGLDQVSWANSVSDEDIHKSMTKMNEASKRDDADFQYASIDLKQRMVELYPDLELPTYFEITKDIPHMNIVDVKGKKFTEWTNKTGFRFLDPDFYIRVDGTLRDMMRREIENKEPESFVIDQQGFKAIERGPKDGVAQEAPTVMLSKETQEWVNENLSTVTTAEHSKLGDIMTQPETTPSNSDSETEDTSWYTGKTQGVASLDGAQGVWNSRVFSKDLLHGMKPDVAKSKFYCKVGDKEYIHGSELNSDFITRPVNGWKSSTPNLGTIHKTTNFVDKDLTSVLKQFKLSPDDAKKKNSEIRKEGFHKALWSYVDTYFNFLPTYNKKERNPFDTLYFGEQIKNNKNNNPSYMYGKYVIGAPEITREKVVNVMKSIMSYTSNYKQWNESNGNVNYDGTSRVGLFGVNCNNTYIDAEKASKTWKGNMEEAVKYFRQCYLRAYNNTDKGGCGYPEARRNPLDWAIAFYGLRKFESNISSLNSSGFYKDVLTIFKNEYAGSVALYTTYGKDLYDEDALSKKESSQILRRTRDEVIRLSVKKTMEEFLKSLFKDTDTEEDKRAFYEAIDLQADSMKAADSYYLPLSKDDLGMKVSDTLVPTALKGSSIKEKDLDLYKSNKKLYDSVYKKGVLPFVVIDPYDEIDNCIIEFVKNLSIPKNLRSEFNKYRNNFDHKDNPVLALIHWYFVSQFSSNNTKRKPYDWTKYIYVVNKGAGKKAMEILTRWYEEEKDKKKFQINHGKVNNTTIRGQLFRFVDVNNVNAMDKVYDDAAQANAEQEYKKLYIEDYLPGAYGETSPYVDLLEHDQRGRLVRAFPTFNIQLIDEGRWYHWQRVFDRFFGYNSIVSIDVMKDRRYPADTATVEFSNIYGTLTSEDTTFSSGQWDFCGLDTVRVWDDDYWNTMKLMWGFDEEEQTRSQAEKLNSLLLAPGARMSIKMGYGSNCAILPQVFIGTIQEVGTGEVVRVVAQGDGIELCNKIADADPKDSTDPGMLGLPKEPRALFADMMSSKGGFFSNRMYNISGGAFFKKNPLGIAHFGLNNKPLTMNERFREKFNMFEEYGECSFNVYTGTNAMSKSQWIYTEGEKAGQDAGNAFGFNIGPLWINDKVDSPNIQIYTFDKTPWDIIQTYAYGCPDYIGTVVPFEYRSSLFFGKPWWPLIDGYEYEYILDEEKGFIRKPINVTRKTYSQLKFYDSYTDIISNGIYASKDGMYTNVATVYNEENGAKRTPIVQVDSDIDIQDQTTAVVSAPIKGNWMTGQSKFAECYALSSLRDYTKLMYKGELVVIGDPTVKPHDTMFISDACNSMTGTTWVRRVVHSFDQGGYTTQITPDLIPIIDDAEGTSAAQNAAVVATSFASALMGTWFLRKVCRNATKIPIARMVARMGGTAATNGLLVKLLLEDASIEKGSLSKQSIHDLRLALGSVDTKDYDDILKLLKNKKVDITDAANIARAIEKYSPEVEKMGKLGTLLVRGGSGTAYAFGQTTTMLHKIAASPVNNMNKVDGWFDTMGDFAKTFRKNSKEYGRLGRTLTTASGAVAKGVVKAGVGTGSVAAKALIVLAAPEIFPVLLFAGQFIIVESLIEKYQRFLRNRQSLVLMPITYHGKPLLAGVKGHRGAVMGDHPSKMDMFLSGNGKGRWGFMDVVNSIAGVEIDYSNYSSQFDEEES